MKDEPPPHLICLFLMKEGKREEGKEGDVKLEVGRPPGRVKLEGLIPGVGHCT